ncbi:16S rRNA (guanine(527)-N(7))-methyltransferase RsmG [Actibacterium sp. MT2.3-13A]|uniref:16S rRNA (guanine(527)-N(7))-methyltransferase RsmG n=1 Tax=Actibacterium sp. MT2.3-13A TaxID=2828332 RepID=UPI001BA45111|nr:16S rRNA (guanine(527)-N(7))-methyltransferase RsmG [Actibacterium sp. MT2.3-13A]
MSHDLAGVDVSRETFERLKTYEALLRKWNPAINLVSRNTLDAAWTRHFVDSAQIFELAPKNTRHWADLGSGGGFPGMVIAILAAERAPEMRVTLVESDQRKATFLRSVAREAGVKAEVIARRIEEVPPLGADVLSARALASLTQLLGFAERHLCSGGIALFPKGAGHQAELDEALETWRFGVHKIPSRTEPGAVILSLGGIARV